MSTAGPGGSDGNRIDAHGPMQEQGKDSSPAGKKQALEHARSMEAAELESLQRVMYRGGLACEEDMARWYTQGFVFCAQPCFGLRQASGGPCGVLAAVQAELVREMLFPADPAQEQGGPALERTVLPQAGELDVNALLAAAMSHILHRAATASSSNNAKGACQIQLLQVEGSSLHLPMTAWQLADLRVITYATEEEARRGILQMLDMYSACTGCVSFLASAILSRGEERLRGDMDDPSSTLIGQFGHCSQDLINLLLTGRGTSNVMDGQVELGDSGLCVRGLSSRSTIGYLSHLEALRYCEVGSFFKVPRVPIWVVGSSSHFSVLFCTSRKVNEESRSERLLSTLQRCFKAVDRDECGFIPADRLRDVLVAVVASAENAGGGCPLEPLLRAPGTDLARLRGHMRIEGEIILWSSFWSNVSNLMSGKSLEQLLSNVVDLTGRARSDSEMARAMQAEMDGFGAMDTDHTSMRAPTTERPRSDSEMARDLQAQWDAEEGAGSISTAVAPLPTPAPSVSSIGNGSSNGEDRVMGLDFSSIRAAVHRSDSIAGDGADSFQMFHFNGLESSGRTAALTRFFLFVRSSVDAVGVHIAYGGEAGGGGATFICPIEEVLRTRWPGCRVQWLEGAPPPSID